MQNLTEFNREQNSKYTDSVRGLIKILKKSQMTSWNDTRVESKDIFIGRPSIEIKDRNIKNNFCDNPNLCEMKFQKNSYGDQIIIRDKTSDELGGKKAVFLPWEENTVKIMSVENNRASFFSTATLTGCSVYMLEGSNKTYFIHCNYCDIEDLSKRKEIDLEVINNIKRNLGGSDKGVKGVKGVSTLGSRIMLSHKFDEEAKDKYKGKFFYERKYLGDKFRYSNYSKAKTISERHELNEKYNYNCNLYKESENVNQLERITVIGVFEDSRWLLFATATKQMAYWKYKNIVSKSEIHTQDKTMVFEITGIDEFKRADKKLDASNILWKDW